MNYNKYPDRYKAVQSVYGVALVWCKPVYTAAAKPLSSLEQLKGSSNEEA